MRKFLESYFFSAALLVLLFGAWIIGLKYELFFLIKWLDMPFHFFGGLFVYIFWMAYSKHSQISITGSYKLLFSFLVSIGFVLFVGVFWEFFELYLDRFITHQGLTNLVGVYEDTLADLFFDFLGGFVGFLMYNKIYD